MLIPRALSHLVFSLILLAAGSVEAGSEGSRFKQLAGPPEDFGEMAPSLPEAAAVHSKSAMLPMVFERTGARKWSWQAELPFEEAGSTIMILEDAALGARAGARKAPLSLAVSSLDGARAAVSPSEVRSVTIPSSGSGALAASVYEFPKGRAGRQLVTVDASEPRRAVMILVGSSPARLVSHQAEYNSIVGETVFFVTSAYDEKRSSDSGAIATVDRAEMEVTSLHDGSTTAHRLADDGLHEDGVAGDGIFGGSFTPDEAGQYVVRLLLEGSDPATGAFLRTGTHAVSVVEPSLRLTGARVGAEVPASGPLQLRLPVQDAQPGAVYHAYAEVWGRSHGAAGAEVPIAWVSGLSVAKDDRLTLGLDQRWVQRANAVAPFSLRNLRVRRDGEVQVLSSVAKVDLDLPDIPRHPAGAGFPAITSDMERGPRPEGLCSERSGHAKFFVHGFCATDAWGIQLGDDEVPRSHFTGEKRYFDDRKKTRGLREFTALLKERAEAKEYAGLRSYSVIAHSMGGMAALELFAFHWSGLDCVRDEDERWRIQSVGSPYHGSPLADLGVALRSMLLPACAAGGVVAGYDCDDPKQCPHFGNIDLTPAVASQWIAQIPPRAQKEVRYFRTEGAEGGGASCLWDVCQFATEAVLAGRNDGVVEVHRGRLAHGKALPVSGFELCHLHGGLMNYPGQYRNEASNKKFDEGAARAPQDYAVTRVYAEGPSIVPLGASVRLKAEVENVGDGSSGVSAAVSFSRSKDPAYRGLEVHSTGSGTRSIAPGESRTFALDASPEALGRWYYTACVTGTEEAGELVAGNDCSPVAAELIVVDPASCPEGVCVPVCGDGIVSAGEECDDGGEENGDGCSAICEIEKIRVPLEIIRAKVRAPGRKPGKVRLRALADVTELPPPGEIRVEVGSGEEFAGVVRFASADCRLRGGGVLSCRGRGSDYKKARLVLAPARAGKGGDRGYQVRFSATFLSPERSGPAPVSLKLEFFEARDADRPHTEWTSSSR